MHTVHDGSKSAPLKKRDVRRIVVCLPSTLNDKIIYTMPIYIKVRYTFDMSLCVGRRRLSLEVFCSASG